ncbi:MAG: SEC-C domain-containing protein, partial [Clostridium sp.]|nr:SEC-C domain-containing protein [Clostridium sp.]
MIKIGRNDPCWCGSGRKYKVCHQAFDDRIRAEKEKGHVVPDHSLLKTPAQIEKIKESCKVNIAVLDFIAE